MKRIWLLEVMVMMVTSRVYAVSPGSIITGLHPTPASITSESGQCSIPVSVSCDVLNNGTPGVEDCTAEVAMVASPYGTVAGDTFRAVDNFGVPLFPGSYTLNLSANSTDPVTHAATTITGSIPVTITKQTIKSVLIAPRNSHLGCVNNMQLYLIGQTGCGSATQVTANWTVSDGKIIGGYIYQSPNYGVVASLVGEHNGLTDTTAIYVDCANPKPKPALPAVQGVLPMTTPEDTRMAFEAYGLSEAIDHPGDFLGPYEDRASAYTDRSQIEKRANLALLLNEGKIKMPNADAPKEYAETTVRDIHYGTSYQAPAPNPENKGKWCQEGLNKNPDIYAVMTAGIYPAPDEDEPYQLHWEYLQKCK